MRKKKKEYVKEYDIQLRQGDIIYCDLGKGRGSEQGGKRPCLVIQNNIGNKHSPTVIVASITSELKKENQPTHFVIKNYKEVGLEKESMIMFEQIQTLSKDRILGKPIGHLNFKKIVGPFLASFGITKRDLEAI